MNDYSELSKDELFTDEVINELMDEQDFVTREQMKFALIDRAAEFGQKTETRMVSLIKAAEKELKKAQQETSKKKSDLDHETDFDCDYPILKCGHWVADMRGIQNPSAATVDRFACPHPILPIQIITNVEEGTQKVKLAYYRSGRWNEQIVRKSIISSRNKITDLADIGIAVTSESAKNLVKYLSDVETLNFDVIPEVRATAKMGWAEDGFVPYTSALEFDKDGRFDSLYSTLQSDGDFLKWKAFVKDIRSSGRIEPRLVLAASFASVLLKICGLLPFWVNIWGKTGGGKSICCMLAASIWADPEIGKYISKFDSTIPAFEARAGFLNHLPFIIDDTAEVRRRLKDDFSQLIYQLASGEGKERSNVKLGLAYKTTWTNTIICSGESPIITDQLQGGAVNRLLEYEMDEGDIFPDGQAAAALLKSNYGFAGPMFVDVISKLGFDKVLKLQQKCFEEIKRDAYEEKQLRSLSALLVADKIATEHIFKDGVYLTFDELEKVLTDKNTLSEHERCYEYILGEVSVNSTKFMEIQGDRFSETWGKYIRDKQNGVEYIAILANVMSRMCQQGGFNLKAFVAWADKKGLLQSDKNAKKTSKLVKMPDGHPQRCYVLKLPETSFDAISEENNDDLLI